MTDLVLLFSKNIWRLMSESNYLITFTNTVVHYALELHSFGLRKEKWGSKLYSLTKIYRSMNLPSSRCF